MNQIILPKNEEHWLELRKPDITSTEISALFGCSPYCTKFELWHRKKKQMATDFEANERTEWGLALQDVIIGKLSKDNNWKSKRKNEYIRIPDLNIGASFDFDLEIENELGLSEVKNVDGLVYRDGWIVDGDYIEAPPHIELQVQHQLLCAEIKTFNNICALVGGNSGKVLPRKPNQKVFDAIILETQKFWKSIADNNPPEPFYEVDADFISKLYSYAEPKEILDARSNQDIQSLVEEYNKYQKLESDSEKKKKECKARILPLIGTASKVLLEDGFSISCGETEEVEVAAHTRAGYRQFRVNKKKEK